MQMISKKRRVRPHGQRDINTVRHISSTGPHWRPLVPSFGNKCISTLDPQTVNAFVFISSVGVQSYGVFIRAQTFPRRTRQTDIKSQKACGQLDGQTDGHIIIPIRRF